MRPFPGVSRRTVRRRSSAGAADFNRGLSSELPQSPLDGAFRPSQILLELRGTMFVKRLRAAMERRLPKT
jgi:hypothetical protein